MSVPNGEDPRKWVGRSVGPSEHVSLEVGQDPNESGPTNIRVGRVVRTSMVPPGPEKFGPT